MILDDNGFLDDNIVVAAFSSFLAILFNVSVIYFIVLCTSSMWRRADVYPALILEKHPDPAPHIKVLLEKVDGAREGVVAPLNFHAMPGEVGVVAVRGRKLRFWVQKNVTRQPEHQAAPNGKTSPETTSTENSKILVLPASPWKRLLRGVVILILDVAVIAITVDAFELQEPWQEPWWERIFAVLVLAVAVYALFLIIIGIVAGLRGMGRKFDRCDN